MRKLKGWMRESKLFDTRIYPVVRLAAKAHLHPRCRSTHKEYCFTAIKSLSRTQSRTLISLSTKELHQEKWGSPRPPHKACHRRSTPSRRVEDVPASHQDSKDGRLTEIHFGSLKNQITRYTTLPFNH